jgi:hypothetical protein
MSTNDDKHDYAHVVEDPSNQNSHSFERDCVNAITKNLCPLR